MQSNFELLRQVLKSKITEAVALTGLRDSIRIHQVADPIDMTQQAAEREMAMQNLNINARELPEAAWGAYISCSLEVPHWDTFL